MCVGSPLVCSRVCPARMRTWHTIVVPSLWSIAAKKGLARWAPMRIDPPIPGPSVEKAAETRSVSSYAAGTMKPSARYAGPKRTVVRCGASNLSAAHGTRTLALQRARGNT